MRKKFDIKKKAKLHLVSSLILSIITLSLFSQSAIKKVEIYAVKPFESRAIPVLDIEEEYDYHMKFKSNCIQHTNVDNLLKFCVKDSTSDFVKRCMFFPWVYVKIYFKNKLKPAKLKLYKCDTFTLDEKYYKLNDNVISWLKPFFLVDQQLSYGIGTKSEITKYNRNIRDR